ncbi:MAG: hypothetical protein GYA51_03265 [Candidatus Methanofastidiosa archaeon]|nr:hypothetical protein [Candidatus Methanofastidiosa archaeon]
MNYLIYLFFIEILLLVSFSVVIDIYFLGVKKQNLFIKSIEGVAIIFLLPAAGVIIREYPEFVYVEQSMITMFLAFLVGYYLQIKIQKSKQKEEIQINDI